jgi:hypothetical protein
MKKLTAEDFIAKSIKKYGFESFIYADVNYINCKTKVQLTCKKCQHVFEVIPDTHLRGNSSCNICKFNSVSSYYTKTKNEFINEAHNTHGIDKYDYSLVDYKNSKIKVKIKCNKCQIIFEQTPDNHLNSKQGCKVCSHNNLSLIRKKSLINFINEAQKVHGADKYDYKLVEYKNSRVKIKIICNKCHTIFEQILANHIYKKYGCRNCVSSKGELFIKNWLDDNQIQYIQQAKFAKCVNKKRLAFDFYIPMDKNTHLTINSEIIIEYQGIQHYEPVKRFGGVKKFELNQQRDQIKRLFAKSNGFNLIEIPYTLSDEEIISLLNFHLKN